MAVRVLARPAQLLIPERNSIFDPRAEGVSLGLGSRLWGLPLSLPPQPLVRKLSGFRRCTVRAARQKLWKNRNRGSSQTVIKGLLEALQHEGANVQEVLERKGAFLPANDWFQVLEAVGKERRWLLALEVRDHGSLICSSFCVLGFSSGPGFRPHHGVFLIVWLNFVLDFQMDAAAKVVQAG